MAEKYYNISPYAYVANNPMKYIDPNGMELYIKFDGDESKKLFEQMANHMIGKDFKLTMNETQKGSNHFQIGIETLKGGNKNNLSKGGQQFLEGLNTIVNSKSVVDMGAVVGSKDVNTGNFETGLIDMADISQFPNFDHGKTQQDGPTQQGKIMHEIGEQFQKAKGKDYGEAHSSGGLYWEDNINGNIRSENEFSKTQTFYKNISTKPGQKTKGAPISTWNIVTPGKNGVIQVYRNR